MADNPNKPTSESILLGNHDGYPRGNDPKSKSVPSILQAKGKSTREALEAVLKGSPAGAVSTALGDTFYGINHRQTPTPIQINKDYFGLTFFTKPRLNLTTDNVRALRQLSPLLNQNPDSLQRIIRCTLDPQLQRGRDGGKDLSCSFVDQNQAFIPVLTNHLLSMNGWPDVVAPTHTTQEGVYKEASSWVDGTTKNYTTYDITANFRNIPGDPITSLFLVWSHYMSAVFEGEMVPYPESILENEIDYNTRIYRLVLDSTKSRVQKIGACGAAFPWSVPIGAAFDFANDRPINSGSDQISIPFRCMGAMYNDDILIYEFNRTVEMFNIMMSETNLAGGAMVKIPMGAMSLFNTRGCYPHIHQDTYELEWYVTPDYYEAVLNGQI